MNWDIKQFHDSEFAQYLMREFPRLDCDDMQRIFTKAQKIYGKGIDMAGDRGRCVVLCQVRTPAKN